MTETPSPYEIFAVRYARRDAYRVEHMVFKDPHDGPMPMDYFVWAIVGNGLTFVLDTGFGPEEAKRRKREFIRYPADGLRMIGVEAEQVEHVILSHMHYDHVGTCEQFPKARFYLQEREMRFATGRVMLERPIRHSFTVDHVTGLVRALYDDRLSFIDGTRTIAPGLSLHHVGGHTDGLQVARVWTRRGWVVLAADASHYYANFEEGAPYRTVYNVGQMLDGFRFLYELADSPHHIVPGHDPLVMQRYPAASKETEGIVVRLDVAPHK